MVILSFIDRDVVSAGIHAREDVIRIPVREFSLINKMFVLIATSILIKSWSEVVVFGIGWFLIMIVLVIIFLSVRTLSETITLIFVIVS